MVRFIDDLRVSNTRKIKIFGSVSRQSVSILGEERGIAMLETAIVAPFLIFIMVFVVDYGRALDQYLSLTSVAREAVSYGSRIKKLGKGSCSTDGARNADGTLNIIHCSHRNVTQLVMHERAQALLRFEGKNLKRMPGNLILASTYSHRTQSVNFTIQGQATSLFGIFYDNIPITVHATAPYLLSNDKIEGVQPDVTPAVKMYAMQIPQMR